VTRLAISAAEGPLPDCVVEIAIASEEWLRRCPEADRLAQAAARAALAGGLGAKAGRHPIIVDITLTDDGEQQRLNRTYRGKDMPTNVLAFPGEAPGTKLPRGAPRLLGDVVLACETVTAEATLQRKPVADHLSHLVVHGVLHLLGHDHEGAADALAMETLETEILAGMGVPDPYADTM
jgi:probable rRNA maturation factor